MGVLGDIAVRARAATLRVETHEWFNDAVQRIPGPMSARQLRAEGLVAGMFLAAWGTLAVVAGDSGGHAGTITTVVLVAALAVLARVDFPVGSGSAVPIQVLFVPMLFLLSPVALPGLVAIAMVLSHVPDVVRHRRHPQRLLLGVSDAWFALGPAAVFAAAGIHGVSWSDWPVWLLALAAQLFADFGASSAREWLFQGKRPSLQLAELSTVWLVDASLAPIGLLAADAAFRSTYAFLLVLPLVALMAAFAQERRFRLEQAIALSRAYQGTALLLGDVIEDDDHYTGEHSRGVVSLALDIADELGVGAHERRLVELGALLHDVGKIRVPKEILNKPGALDDDEWAIMRGHTIEGQRMLDRVGGDMTEVGLIVRASHERWDGGGYPDGLAGNAIALPARIVACADAWSAMTTNRPYRRALPANQALLELRASAGSHFDPRVVDALLVVLERRDALFADAVPFAATAI
jgi:putative nucleotidyltransferase with HDIG domain